MIKTFIEIQLMPKTGFIAEPINQSSNLRKQTSNDVIAGDGRERLMIELKFIDFL